MTKKYEIPNERYVIKNSSNYNYDILFLPRKYTKLLYLKSCERFDYRIIAVVL